MTTETNQFVTVAQTAEPCNKRVYFESDGTLKKRPAQPVFDGIAQTISVADTTAFAAVLNRIGQDPTATLSLGFVPGTEDGVPYHLVSRRLMAERLGVEETNLPAGLQEIDGQRLATRTKDTFASSTWMLFDYDLTEGMPKELKTAEPKQWWSWMCELVPALSNCGYILTRSTSGRVMLGDSPAFQWSGWHAFVQVDDAADIERFGKDLLIQALSTGFGFLRPVINRETGEIIAKRPWSIFDPSTFSPERLVYDGAPTVSGEGLHVIAQQLRTVPGARFDTSKLVITPEVRQAVAQRTGLRVERSGIRGQGGGLSNRLVNDSALKLDTLIETKQGPMTIAEYWRSKHDKLRAQAVFRPDSDSWAAFLSRHKDGTPFLHDIGLNTKYVLDPSQADRFREQRAVDWVNQNSQETVQAHWIDKAHSLNDHGFHSLIDVVKLKTRIPLQVLKAQLKEAKQQWQHELDAEHAEHQPF